MLCLMVIKSFLVARYSSRYNTLLISLVDIKLFGVYLSMVNIYIVIHRQIVSFYQNSSVWLDTWDARSRDRNPFNFTFDSVLDRSANKRTTLAQGIFKVLCSNSSSVRSFTFLYPIGDQSAQFFRRALHYEESCENKIIQNLINWSWNSTLNVSVFITFFRTLNSWKKLLK